MIPAFFTFLGLLCLNDPISGGCSQLQSYLYNLRLLLEDSRIVCWCSPLKWLLVVEQSWVSFCKFWPPKHLSFGKRHLIHFYCLIELKQCWSLCCNFDCLVEFERCRLPVSWPAAGNLLFLSLPQDSVWAQLSRGQLCFYWETTSYSAKKIATG